MPTQSEELIIIRLEGPAFEDYYPAEQVTQIVLLLENLLKSSTEKALQELSGSRPKLRVLAGFPTRGSYVQELLVVWDVAQHFVSNMPAIMPILPEMIQKIGEGIDLLKKLIPAFDSEEEPSMSIEGNKGTIVFNQNQNTFNFDIRALTTAEDIAKVVTTVAQQLGDGINSVAIESPQGPKILLDKKDRSSLGSPRSRRAVKRITAASQRTKESLAISKISDRLEAVADILSFDKVRRTGTLAILESEQLPLQKFSFELSRRPETDSAIAAMLQPRVRVTCQVIGKQKLELLRVEAHLAG